MTAQVLRSAGNNRLKWLFLIGFSASCFVFWWLSPILYQIMLGSEQGLDDDVILLSICAFGLFIFGYLFPWRTRMWQLTSTATVDRIEPIAYYGTVLIAIPALISAGVFTASRWDMEYQEGSGIPLYYQAILYVHLFVGLLYLGSASDERGNRSRIYIAAFLTIMPRLIVSFRWGRFFAAQAIIPVICIAVARSWVRVSAWRLLQFGAIALFLIFVPSLSRGDKIFGEDDYGKPLVVTFFEAGNTLRFYQENLDLPSKCPPLLVSATSKVIPYHLLDVCTVDIGDDKAQPATLDNLLTHAYTDDLRTGSGGNFLLDLYLLGGIPAIILGTPVFGFTTRRLVEWIGRRSLFAGIWSECLSRTLLTPRGDLGYTYERIPSLFLATFAVVALAWAFRVLANSTQSSKLT